MITRYIIITDSLNEDIIEIEKHEFTDEEDLNEYLNNEFRVYINYMVFTPQQFKRLGEEILKTEVKGGNKNDN